MFTAMPQRVRVGQDGPRHRGVRIAKVGRPTKPVSPIGPVAEVEEVEACHSSFHFA